MYNQTQGVWIILNDVLLRACKELIDDAKIGCADLVFKEICLEILTRAKNVLTEEQFEQLTLYAVEKMKEKPLKPLTETVKLPA